MNLTKEAFEKMYYSMTNKEMAEKLGVSTVTLWTYAKKLNLKKARGYNNKKKINIIVDE